jgi:RNA polymerase sigma factor (sigma-70 family)
MNAPPISAVSDNTEKLTQLDDEQLAIVAHESDNSPAQDELLRRCLAQTGRRVCSLAARAGLQEADRNDAQQEAVLWLLEAIRRFRAEESLNPHGCHFRSFLHRVLTARFIDFVRSLRRRESHILLLGLSARDAEEAGALRPVVPSGGDCQTAMEHDELHDQLARELDQLEPLSHHLWDLMVQGVPLRSAATALGISYDAAKRRRRDLFARLKTALAAESAAGSASASGHVAW